MAKDNKKEFSNNPFINLKKQLQSIARKETEGQNVAPARPAPKGSANAVDEDALFARAMQGVQGLDNNRGRAMPVKHPQDAPAFIPIDEELEVMAHLAELVSGEAAINISWQKDFVRGAHANINPQLLAMLEDGRFPIQNYLDLHGLGQEEALTRVEVFLRESRMRGLRHVLIVHGKGKGSKDGESVLKATLTRYLSHKRYARWVLAFCNARPQDGGTGAMYVLLKTWQGPTMFVSRKAF